MGLSWQTPLFALSILSLSQNRPKNSKKCRWINYYYHVIFPAFKVGKKKVYSRRNNNKKENLKPDIQAIEEELTTILELCSLTPRDFRVEEIVATGRQSESLGRRNFAQWERRINQVAE